MKLLIDLTSLFTLHTPHLNNFPFAAQINIEGAFDNEFYNFYGVNRNIVRSPYEMCSELYFDSFVSDIRDNSIGTCLTNDRFMFGHFIEVQWDNEWKIKSKWID